MRNQQCEDNERKTRQGRDILKILIKTQLTIEEEIIFLGDKTFPDLHFDDLPKNITLLLAKVVI